jgi:predicted RNA binding protein YcfA (HicA-like mRNA interferase family)
MPAIYVKQVLELLEENGFYEVVKRTRGSHHRFTDGLGHFVTVSYHNKKDTIPPGTFNSIQKQMGLK